MNQAPYMMCAVRVLRMWRDGRRSSGGARTAKRLIGLAFFVGCASLPLMAQAAPVRDSSSGFSIDADVIAPPVCYLKPVHLQEPERCPATEFYNEAAPKPGEAITVVVAQHDDLVITVVRVDVDQTIGAKEELDEFLVGVRSESDRLDGSPVDIHGVDNPNVPYDVSAEPVPHITFWLHADESNEGIWHARQLNTVYFGAHSVVTVAVQGGSAQEAEIQRVSDTLNQTVTMTNAVSKLGFGESMWFSAMAPLAGWGIASLAICVIAWALYRREKSRRSRLHGAADYFR